MPAVITTQPGVDNPRDVPVVIGSAESRLSTVDTRYENPTTLLTNIEGSRWRIDYYSQVLADDDALSGQQLGRSAVNQQYREIKNYILKVTDPLTSSQDEQTKAIQVTGGAYVPVSLVPNEGDMFIADIGDGRSGIFEVTSSERKSLYRDSVFAISYQLIDYTTKERLSDLYHKVVQKLVFREELLGYGRGPLVSTEEDAELHEIGGKIGSLLNYFLLSFSSSEFKTLMVPKQKSWLYDPKQMQAVNKCFSTMEHPMVRNNRIMNVDDSLALKSPSIWDLFLRREAEMLPSIFTKAGAITVRHFTKTPLQEGIYYSGISYVVFPIDPVYQVDMEYRETETQPQVGFLKSDTDLTKVGKVMVTDVEIPLIHRVDVDDYYIFSEAFYKQFAIGRSALEIQVWNYISGEELDWAIILKLMQDAINWGKVEQYYYLPFVIVLAKLIAGR